MNINDNTMEIINDITYKMRNFEKTMSKILNLFEHIEMTETNFIRIAKILSTNENIQNKIIKKYNKVNNYYKNAILLINDKNSIAYKYIDKLLKYIVLPHMIINKKKYINIFFPLKRKYISKPDTENDIYYKIFQIDNKFIENNFLNKVIKKTPKYIKYRNNIWGQTESLTSESIIYWSYNKCKKECKKKRIELYKISPNNKYDCICGMAEEKCKYGLNWSISAQHGSMCGAKTALSSILADTHGIINMNDITKIITYGQSTHKNELDSWNPLYPCGTCYELLRKISRKKVKEPLNIYMYPSFFDVLKKNIYNYVYEIDFDFLQLIIYYKHYNKEIIGITYDDGNNIFV